MKNSNLALTGEEREYLIWLLTVSLGETRVEAHHTDNVAFKTNVVNEQGLLQALLAKLQSAA